MKPKSTPEPGKVRELFVAAVDKVAPEKRDAFLREATSGDEDLVREVRLLLEAHDESDGLLDAPVVGRTLTVGDRPAEGPGTVIGPYTLRERIGEGGMGVVYVAEQAKPVRRKVALKIIKPGMDTKQVIARFEAERQALALMDHPNIAKVLDAGATESGGPYFVMELVRGAPITEYCDRERLAIPGRLELFVEVCRAVQHAHQKGVIHRDLKPSNILVTLHDGVPVPKVIDFGVAKATGASLTERTLYTGFQQFIGTPLYMSPEQAELAGVDVDTRSDVYALGVLLYELLTGTTPFDAEALRKAAFDEVRRIIREQEPPKPSTRLSSLGATLTTVSANRKADARHLDRAVRGELDWIVMKALEKDRRRRYETASDFASDVVRYLTDQPVEACPPSGGYRLRKFLRRNKGPVAAGLALAGLLVLGTAGTSVGLVWALQAERAATREKERATAAEAKAKEEAAIAKAVNNFLHDDLLAAAAPERNARDKKVTVEDMLGRAAARIAGKFARQQRVEAAIRMTIGNTYRALGNYTAAQPHLERAWEIVRRVRGEEHPDTLTSMYCLASLYMEQGLFSKAEPLFVRALEVRRHILGEEHPDTLRAMNCLAVLYQDQGLFSKAEPLQKRALEVSRRVLGEEHPGTLPDMINLAVLYQKQGRYPKAEPLIARALEVSRRVLGEEHPRTLNAMNSLAQLYVAQGKFDQAEPLRAHNLEVSRRVLGEEHPDTLRDMINLAGLYSLQGRYHEAEPLQKRALEVSRRVLGEEHPDTLRDMINLAGLYSLQGRYHEAESLLVRALEVSRRVLGEEHSDTLVTMGDLGLQYWLQGQLAQAEPLLVRALEVSRRVLGEEHPDTLARMDSLAGLYKEQREYSKAEPLLVQALEVSRRVLGEEHPDTLGSMNNLASLYRYQGELTKAEPLLVRTLEIGRRIYGETHPNMLTAARNLAELYWSNMKLDRSVILFENVLKCTRDKLGPDHPDTLLTMARLGVSYRDAGRSPEGTDLLERAWARALERPDPLILVLAGIPGSLGETYEQAGQLAKAESLYRETLETARRLHKEAPLTTPLQASLARNLLEQQRYAAAEPLLRECLKYRERNEPNDYVTSYTKSLLGGSLLGQKRYDEAEPLLLAGYEGMKEREGKIPPFRKFRLTEAIERLVQLYEATGKTDKAEEWWAKLPVTRPAKPAETKDD